MALNVGKLKAIQEDLVTRGNGDDLYFYAKNIGDETDIRILPPVPELDGSYFQELKVWWIKGKPYVSPATFGLPDPIQEEFDAAREKTKDKQLQALLDDKDKCKFVSEFTMPILLLKPIFEGKNKIVDYEVLEKKAKVLSCGPMLMKAINKLATGRKYQNETEDGFTDRVEGFNFILSKTGTKFDTEYFAEGGDQWEMDKSYYKSYPNVYDIAQKRLLDDDYLRGVMLNYLYGDAMPDESTKARAGADAGEQEEKPTRGSGRSSRKDEEEEKPIRGANRSSRSSKDEEEEKPTRSTTRKPAKEDTEDPPFEEKPTRGKVETKPAGGKGKGRSMLDDLNDLDD